MFVKLQISNNISESVRGHAIFTKCKINKYFQNRLSKLIQSNKLIFLQFVIFFQICIVQKCPLLGSV